MYIQRNNAEKRLIELTKTFEGESKKRLAIHFPLSRLHARYQSEFQLRIAVNILNDVFRDQRGVIFQARDGDVFVIYHGADEELVERAVYQVRYLFADDSFAYLGDGQENPDFTKVYNLAVEWQEFYRACMEQYEISLEGHVGVEDTSGQVMTPKQLSTLMPRLEHIDFDAVLRKQPICAITRDRDIRGVYNEVYINMAHLRELLEVEFDLPSNPWLFQYLLTSLDEHMIKMLRDRPRAHLNEPISLNLTIDTVLSAQFQDFCQQVRNMKNPVTIVMELNVSDIFANMAKMDRVKVIARQYKCRLCVDGLTNESVVWLNPDALEFDLVKLQWNADLKGDLDESRNAEVKAMVKRIGASRFILCRCDTEHAIEYGHELGILLFQGRYPDRVLNPQTKVIN